MRKLHIKYNHSKQKRIALEKKRIEKKNIPEKSEFSKAHQEFKAQMETKRAIKAQQKLDYKDKKVVISKNQRTKLKLVDSIVGMLEENETRSKKRKELQTQFDEKVKKEQVYDQNLMDEMEKIPLAIKLNVSEIASACQWYGIKKLNQLKQTLSRKIYGK